MSLLIDVVLEGIGGGGGGAYGGGTKKKNRQIFIIKLKIVYAISLTLHTCLDIYIFVKMITFRMVSDCNSLNQ